MLINAQSVQRHVWIALTIGALYVLMASLAMGFDGRHVQTATCAVGAALLFRTQGGYRWLAAGNVCMALGLLPVAWQVLITTIGHRPIYLHTLLMFCGDLLWIIGLAQLPGRQKPAWDGWLLVGSVLIVSTAYQLLFVIEEGQARWDALIFGMLFMVMFACATPAWQALLSGRAPQGRLLVFMGLLLLWMNNFAYWIADIYGLYPEDPIVLSFAVGFVLINTGWIGETTTVPVGGSRTMIIGAAAITMVSYASIWTFRQAKGMTLASWLILDGYTVMMALLVLLQNHVARIRLAEARFRKYTTLLDDILQLDARQHILHLDDILDNLLQRLQDIFPELTGFRITDTTGHMPDHLAGRSTEHVLSWPDETRDEARQSEDVRLDIYCVNEDHIASEGLKTLAPLLSRRLHQLLVHFHQQLAARTDPLTGLLNRRGAQVMIPDLTLRCMRDHIPLGVAMIDIDHFKSVNDTFGHHVGDQVILAMAQVIMSQTRHVDCAVRWGGEEFLVLLHGCDLSASQQTIQRILDNFKSKAYEGINDGRTVTGSAGISGGRVPRHFQEIESWIQIADALLYEAKRAGRDRIVSKSP